jgi:hypothetical protein
LLAWYAGSPSAALSFSVPLLSPAGFFRKITYWACTQNTPNCDETSRPSHTIGLRIACAACSATTSGLVYVGPLGTRREIAGVFSVRSIYPSPKARSMPRSRKSQRRPGRPAEHKGVSKCAHDLSQHRMCRVLHYHEWFDFRWPSRNAPWRHYHHTTQVLLTKTPEGYASPCGLVYRHRNMHVFVWAPVPVALMMLHRSLRAGRRVSAEIVPRCMGY